MIKTLIFIGSILLQVFSYAQLKEAENYPGIRFEYSNSNTVTVIKSDSSKRTYYVGSNSNPETRQDIPQFTFFWWADTQATSSRYYLDQVLPLVSDYEQPLLSDVNNNGLIEIYGKTKGYYTPESEIWCYEENLGGVFAPVYKYAENTIMACNIYDLDRDGEQELHLLGEHLDSSQIGYVLVQDQTFFKKATDTSLAKEFFFKYNIWQGTGSYIQLNDLTYGDFDKDDTTDVIFFNFSPKQIRLATYNNINLTFDSLLAWESVWDSTGWGEDVEDFIVGDFDLDRKTDIMYSSTYGNIYILENEGIDTYSINWTGNSGIYNSYIDFKTQDIDNNGKPEFWVGGENFDQGSKIVCYEMSGDNRYEPVCEIQFPDLVSLYNLFAQSIDIDNDGVEEIFVSIGNVAMILKFCGQPNVHDYKVFYSHRFDYHNFGAVMHKFPNQNTAKIIVCMYQNRGNLSKYLSYLLSFNEAITNTEPKTVLMEYELFNNYPNPFNPSTKIKFNLGQEAFVNLTISNSLGERVAELKNEVMPPGSCEVEFNASNLPSGVYFYTLKAGEYVNTKKMILIK